MRKKRKKEKTELVLRQQMVSGKDDEKAVSLTVACMMHGLLLFVWTSGCLKWIDEVLSLHMNWIPLLTAVGIFCLIFEAAVRISWMWRAVGAAILAVFADVLLNRAVLARGFQMMAVQAGKAISEYYHLDAQIETMTLDAGILLHNFILLAAVFVLLGGVATVKWRSKTVPGMVFVILLTASLMVDCFPDISTLMVLLAGTAGLMAVRPAENPDGREQKGVPKDSLGYMKAGLYGALMVLLATGLSYGAAKWYVAGKMHSYYEDIKTYPQQMIAGMQSLIAGRNGEDSKLEQWMNGLAADFNVVAGQLTNAAPVQTGAVVLRVDTTVKPKSALYFRSYIGQDYDIEKEEWQILDDAAFQAAYADWTAASEWPYSNVKSMLAMRLYDRLREAGLSETCSYHIENTGAGKACTWAPYGVDISGTSVTADGILAGGAQTLFVGYPMEESEELMEWLPYAAYSSENEDLFSEYTDYVYETYLDVPEGLSSLQKGYDLLRQDYGDMPASEWIRCIRDDLEQRCRYERYGLAAVPDGDNIINNFYGSQKKGYCLHFASAGVMMLRMAGIPARYVSGYVAWPDDFSYDEDSECYHADITGYRGHAWVEIYDAALGAWLPVEMTPADSVQHLGPENAGGEQENDAPVTTETEEMPTETSQPTETYESETSAEQGEPVEPAVPETAPGHTMPADDNSTPDDDPPSMTEAQNAAHGEGQPVEDTPDQEAGHTFLGKDLVLPMILTVLALAFAGFCLYRSRMGGDMRRFSRVNRNKGVLSMEWHLTEVTEMAGWPDKKNMDDWSYARWMQEKVDTLEDGEYLFFMEKLHQAAYSEEMLSEEDYQKCFAIYQKIMRRISGEMKGIKKIWWQYVKGYKF